MLRNTVAVVGLGDLGSAVARRLHPHRPLLVVDPDPAARECWNGRADVTSAASIGAAEWSGVERVHLLVRTQQQAVDVLDELDRHVAGGIAVHLHTTVSVAAATEFGARPRANMRLLEQPITGGAAGVRDGRATVLSAGPARESDCDWIGHFAARVVTFASYGAPTLAKLVNNTVAAATTRVTASLLGIAVAHGLEIDAMREVLRHGSGGSWMAEALPGLGDDQATLLVKDVRLLEEQVGRIAPLRLDDEPSMLADVASFHAALTAAPRGR